MTVKLPTPGPHHGPHVEARQFLPGDVDAMAQILLDPRLYQHGYVMHRQPNTPDEARAIAEGFVKDPAERDGAGNGRLSYAFTLRHDSPLGPAGTLIGSSSLAEVHLHREQAHLGWTVLHPDLWSTGANAENKWILLRHAFEDCGLGRVKIQTDSVNTRSQAAIAKLGATREGVLRRDQPRDDGSWRDTVVFSILRDEWPRVSEGLQARFATWG